MSIEEIVVEEEVHRSCSRPRRVVVEGETYYVRCKSVDFELCPSCASAHARQTRVLIESGFKDEAGHVRNDASFWFMTLTAPGMTFKDGRFKVSKAVQWNEAATKLFNRTMDGLNRNLPGDMEYARVVEYQKRGMVHFHILLRVHSSDEQGIERVLNTAPDYTADGYRWGGYETKRQKEARIKSNKPRRGFDVQPLSMDDLESTSDYASKNVGADNLHIVASYASKMLGRTSIMPAETREQQQLMKDECLRLGMSDKKARGLGFGGQVFSKSKNWCVLTKKALQEAEIAYAQAHEDDADRLNTRALRYEDHQKKWSEILTEEGYSGTYQNAVEAPQSIRNRIDGVDVCPNDLIAAEWLTAAQIDEVVAILKMKQGQLCA